MDYQIVTSEKAAIVHVRGRWTFSEHALARTMIRAILDLSVEQVIIDASQLDYIDSAGIGMLLIAYEEMRNQGKSPSLIGAQGRVSRVFQAARLEQIFTDNLNLYRMPSFSVFSGPRRPYT